MRTLCLIVLITFRLFSTEIDPAVLSEVSPYLLQDKELIYKLDKIFKKSRVLAHTGTLDQAGFRHHGSGVHTSGVHVMKHKKLKGYLIKCFTDDFKDKEDWIHFLWRVKGAEAIRKAIELQKAESQFKVPRKWIYKIPDDAPQGPHHFVLVVEDMKVLSHSENKDKWKKKAGFTLLYNLYHILNNAGAADSNFVDNIPFCEDGKVAFIDTEIFNRWPVKFSKMDKYLFGSNREYWIHLYQSGGVR